MDQDRFLLTSSPKYHVQRIEKEQSPLKFIPQRASSNNPGGFLLSHTVARAVPSAPRGLTSVFGMGTGVALSTQPPENSNAGVRGRESGVRWFDSTGPRSCKTFSICHLRFDIFHWRIRRT